jgi:hypothetical protein
MPLPTPARCGDLHNARVRRIRLPIRGVTQLHADLVMVLIGLTVGLLAASLTLGINPVCHACSSCAARKPLKA